MDSEKIRMHAALLPTVELGRQHTESEVWEGDEDGAHFIVSRNTLVHGVPHEMIALSVSGPPKARQNIINDFCTVFGPPAELETYPEEPDRIDAVYWLTQPRRPGYN